MHNVSQMTWRQNIEKKLKEIEQFSIQIISADVSREVIAMATEGITGRLVVRLVGRSLIRAMLSLTV